MCLKDFIEKGDLESSEGDDIAKELLTPLKDKNIEDSIKHGGLGSLILEEVNRYKNKYDKKILCYGIDDKYVTHGDVFTLLEEEKIYITRILAEKLGKTGWTVVVNYHKSEKARGIS